MEELSTLAATYADEMQLDLERSSMSDIEMSRRHMRELATLVARFTISMSSDDCGGQSEYSEVHRHDVSSKRSLLFKLLTSPTEPSSKSKQHPTCFRRKRFDSSSSLPNKYPNYHE